MEAEVDPRTEQLRNLRRKIAAEWPESASRDVILRVLDEMVLEAAEEDAP